MNEIRETIAALKKYAKISIGVGLIFLLAAVVFLILYLLGVFPEYFTIIAVSAGAACFLIVGLMFLHTVKTTTKTLDELEKDYNENQIDEAFQAYQEQKND
jgi:flagellar biosynthesis/type III secretory pathway M-ring protein FliF/YscJ